MFAFVRDGVICIFQSQCDGGDDTDPSVKPDDADEVLRLAITVAHSRATIPSRRSLSTPS